MPSPGRIEDLHRERDLEEHAQDGAVPKRGQPERHREPWQRPLTGEELAPQPDEQPADDDEERGPADRPEREIARVERQHVDRDEDHQGDREASIRRPEQQGGRRDDGQGQPSDRARVDVGQDLVAIEVDRVRAVEDADDDVHARTPPSPRDTSRAPRGSSPAARPVQPSTSRSTLLHVTSSGPQRAGQPAATTSAQVSGVDGFTSWLPPARSGPRFQNSAPAEPFAACSSNSQP